MCDTSHLSPSRTAIRLGLSLFMPNTNPETKFLYNQLYTLQLTFYKIMLEYIL